MNDLYDCVRGPGIVVKREGGVACVTGPDRVTWLQGMISNDVSGLAPGAGCFAAHLNARGKVLSLMVVLADEDQLWLELGQDVGPSVADLDKLLIMEDAEIADRSGEFEVLSLVGSGARDAVQDLTGSVPDESVLYSHMKSGATRIVRSELGYDLIVESGQTEATLSALEKNGVKVAGHDLWDLLTLEAGLPLYGIDVDDTTTLPELGEKGIDYKKGCYIGQEVVAKIKYLGHVNRNLVGLKLEGSDSPPPGAGIRRNDKAIGAITRAAYSGAVGSVIALAYLRLGNEAPGTSVEVVVNDVAVMAEVSPLPFVNYFES